MAPQNTNSSGNGEAKTQKAIPNEPREQYVKMLQDYHNDPSLSYEKLAKNIKRNPEIGPEYDQQVVKEALKTAEKSPDALSAAIAQGPYVQNHLNPDKQQNVSSYLAEIQKSYTSAQNIQQEQLNKQQNNGQQPEQQQATITSGAKSEIGAEVVPVQKGLREAEDYALGIVQMLDQRRINVDRLQIDVNGETVFKMRDGDINSRKTSITTEHTELIKKALSDPASLNGSVKITQGNQVLLHVSGGRVLIDSAGLTKQSAKVEVNTPDSPSKVLYERFSKEVNSNGLQATKDTAVNALKAGVKHEQVIDMLKAHDPSYQKLAQSQGEKVAERTFGKLVDDAEVKLMQEKMPQQQHPQEVKASKSVKV